MPKTHKDTPARRAKLRRDPAIFQAPPKVKGNREDAIRNLSMVVRGRTYPIGLNIEGQTPWSMGCDQTGTISVSLRDPTESLLGVLADEDLLQIDGVSVTIDGVIYMVSGVDDDGDGLVTLTLEDEVSWRLKQFDSYMSAGRDRTTRYGFIYGFVLEASRKPFPKMRAFVPEVEDK